MKNWWDTTPLDTLSIEQWEALCDGCGWCCAHRFEDEDTGELTQTRVVCDLLDLEHARCTKYQTRKEYVPDCWVLDVQNVIENASRLPTHCAYRARAENKPLPSWHPLNNSGQLGGRMLSVSSVAVHEDNVHPRQMFEMTIDLKGLVDERS